MYEKETGCSTQKRTNVNDFTRTADNDDVLREKKCRWKIGEALILSGMLRILSAHGNLKNTDYFSQCNDLTSQEKKWVFRIASRISRNIMNMITCYNDEGLWFSIANDRSIFIGWSMKETMRRNNEKKNKMHTLITICAMKTNCNQP